MIPNNFYPLDDDNRSREANPFAERIYGPAANRPYIIGYRIVRPLLAYAIPSATCPRPGLGM